MDIRRANCRMQSITVNLYGVNARSIVNSWFLLWFIASDTQLNASFAGFNSSNVFVRRIFYDTEKFLIEFFRTSMQITFFSLFLKIQFICLIVVLNIYLAYDHMVSAFICRNLSLEEQRRTKYDCCAVFYEKRLSELITDDPENTRGPPMFISTISLDQGHQISVTIPKPCLKNNNGKDQYIDNSTVCFTYKILSWQSHKLGSDGLSFLISGHTICLGCCRRRKALSVRKSTLLNSCFIV